MEHLEDEVFAYNEALDIQDNINYYGEDSNLNQNRDSNRITNINNIVEVETIEPNLMYFCKSYIRATSLIKTCHNYLLKKDIEGLKDHLKEVKCKLNKSSEEEEMCVFLVKMFYLGISHFKEGECEEALACFNEALKIYDYYQLNYNIALCYIKLDQLDNAAFYLEKVTKKNKSFIFAYYNLIRIYLKKNNINDAYMIYKEFSDSIKKDKENQLHGISGNRLSLATFNAYKLFYKLGAECCFAKSLYQECVHTILEALKFNPQDPELFCLYAKVFIMKKAFEFAKPLLEKALEINPDYNEASELLSILRKENL